MLESTQDFATQNLIASNRVEGTVVYNLAGERLGTISHFMVDKRSGKVDYAVLQFGGLFGLGSDYYPLPWQVLTYDPAQGGYIVNLDKTQLENAPHYGEADTPTYDRNYNGEIFNHYGLTYI